MKTNLTTVVLSAVLGLAGVLGSTSEIARSQSRFTPRAIQAEQFAQGPGNLGGRRLQVRVCTRNANGKVNIRTGPGTEYSSIAQIPNGTIMNTVMQDTGSDGYQWYALELGNVVGWARGDFLCR